MVLDRQAGGEDGSRGVPVALPVGKRKRAGRQSQRRRGKAVGQLTATCVQLLPPGALVAGQQQQPQRRMVGLVGQLHEQGGDQFRLHVSVVDH